MGELSLITKNLRINPEQVQDFTPTPMTLATVIYYSGIDPYSGKKVYCARSRKEKLAQRKYFFWYKKEYRKQITSELKKAGRLDIIKNCFPGIMLKFFKT